MGQLVGLVELGAGELAGGLQAVLLRVILVAIALSEGGFMLLDGSRNLVTGTYFGGEPLGPWALLVVLVGLDPHHFGAVFVGLGLAWLSAVLLLLWRVRFGLPFAIVVGLATLWYLPVGTFLAVVWVGFLVLTRREWLPEKSEH